MLARHRADCAILPAMYARSARVESCMDRAVRFEQLLRDALARVDGDVTRLPLIGGGSATFSTL